MHPLLFPWTIPAGVLTALAYLGALLVGFLASQAVRRRGGSVASTAISFLGVAGIAALLIQGKLLPLEDQPLPIHTYGVMIALGFLFAIHLSGRAAQRYATVDGHAFYLQGAPALRGGTFGEAVGKKAKDQIQDLAFVILVGAMVGARALFILVNWGGPDGYAAHPERIFQVWTGGLVFYGGFIGATLASVWYARKHKIRFRALADIVIPTVALGHFFGRMGCMAAGCCWGKVCEDGSFLLGAKFPEGALAFSSMVRDPEWTSFLLEHGHTPALHPTQMYEGLGELSLFLLLLFLRKNKRFHGQILALWLMLYAVLRLSIETFRGDWGRGMLVRWPEVDPLLLSTSQVVGICMLILGATLFVLWKPRKAASPSAGAGTQPQVA